MKDFIFEILYVQIVILLSSLDTINEHYLYLFSTGIMAEERGATLYATDERYDKHI